MTTSLSKGTLDLGNTSKSHFDFFTYSENDKCNETDFISHEEYTKLFGESPFHKSKNNLKKSQIQEIPNPSKMSTSEPILVRFQLAEPNNEVESKRFEYNPNGTQEEDEQKPQVFKKQISHKKTSSQESQKGHDDNNISMFSKMKDSYESKKSKQNGKVSKNKKNVCKCQCAVY